MERNSGLLIYEETVGLYGVLVYLQAFGQQSGIKGINDLHMDLMRCVLPYITFVAFSFLIENWAQTLNISFLQNITNCGDFQMVLEPLVVDLNMDFFFWKVHMQVPGHCKAVASFVYSKWLHEVKL